MSQDGQEFSVREVLQFIHDALRFMRIGPLDRHGWISRDPSPDLAICTAGFKAQPIVRLVGNVVRHSGSNSNQQLSDVIQLLQQSLNVKLEWLADQGLFDAIIPWIGPIVTENRASVGRLMWTDIRPNESQNPSTKASDPPAESETVEEVGPSPPDPVGSSSKTNEVVIHVVDDVRGGHRDFTLPANILLDKMPYFAKATKGSVYFISLVVVFISFYLMDRRASSFRRGHYRPLRRQHFRMAHQMDELFQSADSWYNC